MHLLLTAPMEKVSGDITLEGSKSISNRLLIMQALSPSGFDIINLSPSDDTTTLHRLLKANEPLCDVGAAGTTMRFLTAYFSLQPGERILTGSTRMQKRPIGILVDALRSLGADIQYLGREGFPPMHISGKTIDGGKVKIKADVSSQFISALLLVGPCMHNGIILELEGKIASYPYINMTLQTMHQCGISFTKKENVFTVFPGSYHAVSMRAESDWSAASYYFSVCALSCDSDIAIHGLMAESLQGDSVLPTIYRQLGVISRFEKEILNLRQTGNAVARLEYDFSNCPDLAQTVAVTCAALGVEAHFTGVESLMIKETDRTMALSMELKKFGVDFFADGNGWTLRGKTTMENPVMIETYEDHRMAMSFAPLALVHNNIMIAEPLVVKKSYPSFWSDLGKIGFTVSFS